MLYQPKNPPAHFHLSVPDMEMRMAVRVIWQLLPRQDLNLTTLMPRPIYHLLNPTFLLLHPHYP